MDSVNIVFPKEFVIIAGYECGIKTFNQQVLRMMVNNKKIIIHIPESILIVQGFIFALSKKMDKRDFFKRVEIRGNEKVVSNFNKFVINELI